MSFNPSLSVKATLDHLSRRLDPIIARRLAPHLNGLPWTAVLDALDDQRNYARTFRYETNDLHAQLRMLTERLGTLGYPFDDTARFVSTTGSKLRIIRNVSAHNGELSVGDAFRASDDAVELLKSFRDHDGAAEVESLRREALQALAAEEGVSVSVAAEDAALPALDTGDEDEELEDGPVTPSEDVLHRAPGHESQILGATRAIYEPWTVVPVGHSDVLDNLRTRRAYQQVRSVATEIVTFEGPIHMDRLTRLTGYSFGMKRLTVKRQRQIAHQVHKAGLYIDEDRFVWPREIDPNSWSEFRPNDNEAGRHFLQISPVEIANAGLFIRTRHPEMTERELEDAILQTFGKKRRGAAVMDHLEVAQEIMAQS